jgi:hypothetical protein
MPGRNFVPSRKIPALEPRFGCPAERFVRPKVYAGNSFPRGTMKFTVGETVAFRREVALACKAPAMLAFRAVVTAVSGQWLFLRASNGMPRVMPAAHMAKVGRTGVVLEVV